MKCAAFTQTHGEERILEIQLLSNDLICNHIRNKCDLIIFSFHNSPREFIDKCKSLLEDKFEKNKLMFIEFNDISFRNCIESVLDLLIEKDIDYFMQIEDDTYGINNVENVSKMDHYNDIQMFLKEMNPDYLTLYGEHGTMDFNSNTCIRQHKTKNLQFNCFDSSCLHRSLKNNHCYSFCAWSFIIKVKLYKCFFSKMPKNINNPWQIELFVKHIFDNNKIHKWGIESTFIRSTNFHGVSINRSMTLYDNIKRFFEEHPNWNEIVKHIEVEEGKDNIEPELKRNKSKA